MMVTPHLILLVFALVFAAVGAFLELRAGVTGLGLGLLGLAVFILASLFP